MKKLTTTLIALSLIFSIAPTSWAGEKTERNAKIAGASAATATAVATGATAATMSGAGMMTAAATLGAGSAAVGVGVIAIVPLAVGGSVYFLWKWIDSDDHKKTDTSKKH